MTLDDFKRSLSETSPPEGLDLYLESLWHDAHGHWHKAHNLIQDKDDRRANSIHAYLHRKEGDLGNATYWYHRAGISMPKHSLEEEWCDLVSQFL
jgi:hypothetical protein